MKGSESHVEGFEATVQRHQRRVYSFARYYLGNPEEAEDVTQEVFLRLWRHRDTVDKDRLTAWLMRVTRNACFDLLRKRRSAARVFAQDAGDTMIEWAPTHEPDPDDLAQAADFRRRLVAALGRLQEPQRSILILREIQGLKYREIVEAIDLPLNTVRVYLHRGRKRLRDHLREEYEDVAAS